MADLGLRSQPSIGSALVTQARSTGPGVIELGRRSGGGKLDRVGRQTEAMKDLADGARAENRGDESQAAPTVRTVQYVELEAGAHELRPRQLGSGRRPCQLGNASG